MHTKIQIGWQALACFVVFVASAWYHVGDAIAHLEPNQFGYDFQLRYNEAKCVLARCDPDLIWKGELKYDPYVSFDQATPLVDGSHDVVGTYPPWEYPLMMPLALLPKRIAQHSFFGLGVLCSIGLIVWGVLAGWRSRGRLEDGLLCGAVAVLPVFYAVYCLNYLNFGVMIAAAAVCLAVCLDRGRQVLAGVCWSLMMVKPQIALLFAIPLLVGRRFLTIAVAAGICLFLTMVSAIACGRSPIAMILAIFHNQGMFPRFYLLGPVVTEWLQGFSPMLPLLVNATLGVAACAVLSWKFRMSDGWLTRLLPTLTLCWLWSVSRFYDQSVLVVSFVAVALYLLRSCATQWRIWLVLGMLALQKAVLWTHSVAIPVVALLALMAALVGMVVASDRRTKEIATASALFFASVSLFPSLDGDVASPVFALSLLAFSRMQSGLAMFAVLAFVVSCCVLVELSPWTCSPILYYMECGLLCLCPIETDHSIMDSQECPETSQLSPCG